MYIVVVVNLITLNLIVLVCVDTLDPVLFMRNTRNSRLEVKFIKISLSKADFIRISVHRRKL